MMCSIFFAVLILCAVTCDAQNRISCGSIRDHSEIDTIGDQRTCFIGSDAALEVRNYQFSEKNNTVKGLSFGNNKRISYLPIYVEEKFPNLLVLSSSSPLRSISKENFKGMQKLRALIISNGRIEKLYSDTFDDLDSLEHLDMRGNQLRHVNVQNSFGGFDNLATLMLRDNKCIDQNFDSQEKILAYLFTITKSQDKCGFCLDGNNTQQEFCEMHQQTLDNIQYLIETAACFSSSNDATNSLIQLTNQTEGEKLLLMSHGQQEKTMKHVSPFLIEKTVEEIAGKTYMKLLPSGSILIKTENVKQAQGLIQLTHLPKGVRVKVEECEPMNSRRGLIFARELLIETDVDILSYLRDQNVTAIQREFTSGNKETGKLIITFGTSELPKTLKCGYMNYIVRPLCHFPTQCGRCKCPVRSCKSSHQKR